MYRKRQKILFDRFFRERSRIIEKYEKGEIDKGQFLEENYMLIKRIGILPFVNINSLEKGMYNYQYYNVLAKHYRNRARKLPREKGRQRDFNNLMNRCDHYYKMKDKTSYSILKHLDFENIVAYYVQTDSKGLKNKLFEIVLLDYDEAIFHSKSQWLQSKLESAGIFKEGIQTSVISEYINEKY